MPSTDDTWRRPPLARPASSETPRPARRTYVGRQDDSGRHWAQIYLRRRMYKPELPGAIKTGILGMPARVA
ncbi:MAG TPA: hypothetical protein VKA15_19775 [Isosphaeraceae bacterium]|nr:hypothetical protein [Isosphaeraceae bacterium]